MFKVCIYVGVYAYMCIYVGVHPFICVLLWYFNENISMTFKTC